MLHQAISSPRKTKYFCQSPQTTNSMGASSVAAGQSTPFNFQVSDDFYSYCQPQNAHSLLTSLCFHDSQHSQTHTDHALVQDGV